MGKQAGMFAGEVTPQAPADEALTDKYKGYWWMEYGRFVPGDCNEIWEIGSIIPDLHVGGVISGVWNGDLIEGIGVLKDDRLDTIYTTNENENYTLWGGYNPGIDDGVAEVFFPECQWYNYAGPLMYDLNAGHTNDFTGTEWNVSGSGTVALDADHITGTPNGASTATATGSGFNVWRTSALYTTSNHIEPMTAKFIFLKDELATNYTRLMLRNDNAPFAGIHVLFNQADGSAYQMSTSDGDNMAFEVRDNGLWWEVYLQCNSDGSNLNEANQNIEPSFNTDGSETRSVLIGGKIVMGNTSIVGSGNFGNPATIGNIRGSAVQISAITSAVTDQSRCWVDATNHDNTEGGYYLEWRPLYGYSEITDDIEILSLNDTTGLLYYDYTTQLLTATDGTNTATVPLTLIAETKYRVGVTFGNSLLRVGVDTEWGVEVPYDGSFAGGSDLTICRNPLHVNYWRELRGFHISKAAAESEINDLMAGDPHYTPQPYNPGWMTYDGSTGYYGAQANTSGNKLTFVVRFDIASFSGGGAQRVFSVRDSGGTIRAMLFAMSNDHALPTYRDKVYVIVGSVGIVVSTSTVVDGNEHVLFFSYDADIAATTMYIDGVDEHDTSHPDNLVNSGAIPSGSNSRFGVGSGNDIAADNVVNGRLGYFGYRDAYLTNPLSFMNGSSPLKLNEGTWNEWGSQPMYWEEQGKMHDNHGSEDDMTLNGTVTGPAA